MPLTALATYPQLEMYINSILPTDTIWNGKEWHMYTTAQDGTKVPKGMKMVLEEYGVSTAGKGALVMGKTLHHRGYPLHH